MSKVAVITDSVACLTKEQLQTYGIRVVPLYLTIEGKLLRDGVDVTPSEAYELFLKNPNSFATSAPSPADYFSVFSEASKSSDSIVCVTLSSRISATHNNAVLAKEYAAKEMPGFQIEIVDSLTATSAEGFVALAAARASEAGKSFAEVVESARQIRDRVKVLVLLDTIKHVYRSGRVPKIAAQAGSILNIRPLFNISGKVNLFGVVRSFEKGISRILDKMKEEIGHNPVHISVLHAYAPEEAEKLQEQVAREFNCTELWVVEFSPIMGYACGTGTLGLAFYTDN